MFSPYLSSISLNLSIMFIFQIIRIHGFSYNIYSKIVYKPRSYGSNNHSYFGYTTLLRNDKTPIIVVGAPRETSNHANHYGINDPGVIYVCEIKFNTTETYCYQTHIDISGNTRRNIANGKSHHHRKDNMWLGMSLDGATNEEGTTVVCAPRWVNQLLYERYYSNGICYVTKDIGSNPSQSSTSSMLIPLIDQYKQLLQISSRSPYGSQAYYYAFGQAGVSTKLSDDGNELLIGAPGVYIWTGTVIKYKILKINSRENRLVLQNTPNPAFTADLKPASYLGYSVGFGKFISNKPTLYVAGAPRGSDCKGEVLVFDFNVRDDNPLYIYAKLEGHQLGEYFGYVIATIDINQDGLTDLIIGAPTYTDKSSWDVGRVYVYMNQDKGRFVEQDSVICGSHRGASRFGSSISEIGDINGDGYTDVAIGSPYENHGNGAVYIFLGNEEGLNNIYVQRISVDSMRGFGISISKGVDIDQNTCNDIVIGAHDSRHAVLYRCHPSVDITPTIETIPNELSLNDTEFTVEICIRFHGTAYETNLSLELHADTEYRRVALRNENDSLFEISGNNGTTECKSVVYDLKLKSMDYSRPIAIQLNYDLKKNPMTDYTFCKHCPVLRPTTKKNLKLNVPFATGCGREQACYPNLIVTMESLSMSPFIIGMSENIVIKIMIKNIGEPAFLTKTNLKFPKQLPVLRVPPQCQLTNLELMCDFDNPLKPNYNNSLLIEFDTRLLKNSDKFLLFTINGTSGGQEANIEDNSHTLNLTLKNEIKLNMVGSYGSFQYVNIKSSNTKSENITITHSYEILNDGISTLDSFLLTFFLPVAVSYSALYENLTVLNVYEPTVTMNQQTLVCNPIVGKFSEQINNGLYFANQTEPNNDFTTESYQSSTMSAETIKPDDINYNLNIAQKVNTNLKYLMTKHGESLSIESYNLNCTNSSHISCLVVECIGSDLKPGKSGIQVSFPLLLNTSNLDKILMHENLIILSTYAFMENELDLMSLSTWTRTLLVNSLPSHSSTPIWLYIVGVIIGIIIFSTLVFILYKFGFFERKEKEEMELLKHQEGRSIEDLSN